MPRNPRPDDLMTHVGRRLVAIRRLLDVQQLAFANAIGVEPTALSNWENGIRLADPVAMIRLSQRFQIPLDFIYAGQLRGFDFEDGERLRELCAELGAAIGAPAPEFPMQAEAAEGIRAHRKPGHVPKPRRRGGTLHEPVDKLS
jgi:transcriptional regulator with XRE-family HTH domain